MVGVHCTKILTSSHICRGLRSRGGGNKGKKTRGKWRQRASRSILPDPFSINPQRSKPGSDSRPKGLSRKSTANFQDSAEPPALDSVRSNSVLRHHSDPQGRKEKNSFGARLASAPPVPDPAAERHAVTPVHPAFIWQQLDTRLGSVVVRIGRLVWLGCRVKTVRLVAWTGATAEVDVNNGAILRTKISTPRQAKSGRCGISLVWEGKTRE